jgi:probable F420-dependent oxidoreductase
MKPYRFGAMTSAANIPPKNWIKTVQHIEELGYSTVFVPDHFYTISYDPTVLLSFAASATKKLNVGTLVFDVDYRHPVILAKTAAVLHLLSGGRFEFGIGAGWSESDYQMSGMPFDKSSIRIERLDEALTIIRSMWTQEKTTFEGKHYHVMDMVKAGELLEGEHPKIIVGGGGNRLLSVAGRHADIVCIHFQDHGGKFSGDNITETTLSRVKERVSWVEESVREARRDLDGIEYQMLFPWAQITDDPEPVFEGIAKSFGVSVDAVMECPQWLIGSSDDVVDKIRMIREETGITYMVFAPRDVESFDKFSNEVMKRLT